ncbi:MAG: MmgE/PrpD family protein [Acidimicrobiia bacterium]
MVPEVTRRLAELAVGTPAGAVPDASRRHVARALLDLAGVALAGATTDAGRIAREHARAQGGPGPSVVFGGGTRLSPSLAALANGTAAHALDLDDIGLGVGHISVAVLPAVLAVAEQEGSSGAAFADAVVLGYEVASRLTRMFADQVSGPYAAGYHKPSLYAVFGGVAAAARLAGLDVDGTRRALGIAASQAGGLRVNFGTMTKPFHAGVANRTAVEAVLLARAGFTASTEALEGRFGWHEVLCRGEGELDHVVKGLGEGGFAIDEGLVFKRFPCCGANHYAIEGVLALREEMGLLPDRVAGIDVELEARQANDVLVYDWPATGLEGKFSLAFNVAAALVDGTVDVATFEDRNVARLAPVRDRIRVVPRTDLPELGAVVTVRTTDGREVRREQRVLRGSLDQPLTWDELAAKFAANAVVALDPRTAAEVVERVGALVDQALISDVTGLLAGDAALS